MGIFGILIFILFGFLIGLIARAILGYSWQKGFIFLTLCGIGGVFLGDWLFRKVLKIQVAWGYLYVARGVIIPWLWGIIAAVIIILVIDRLGSRRYFRR
jgi:uncharacterized membrane protein YeaQ/YmgE (transglycosylase-associated protein family)